jgi:hypothetical protein
MFGIMSAAYTPMAPPKGFVCLVNFFTWSYPGLGSPSAGLPPNFNLSVQQVGPGVVTRAIPPALERSTESTHGANGVFRV